MHKFLIKNEVGQTRDFGSSERAAKLARQIVGRDAVCAVQGRDVLWLLPQHADYFRALVGEFKIVNTAHDILAHGEKVAEAACTPASAERVHHPKFGEGSVVHGRGTGRVLVKFDSQKKPLAIAEDFIAAA